MISVSVPKYLCSAFVKKTTVCCIILDFGMILMLVIPRGGQTEEVAALLFQREVVYMNQYFRSVSLLFSSSSLSLPALSLLMITVALPGRM